jgi:hypothetical protein
VPSKRPPVTATGWPSRLVQATAATALVWPGRDSLSWPRRDGLKWLHLDEGSASL